MSYAVRYQTGREWYERSGFRTLWEAEEFIRLHTSACNWEHYRVLPNGTWQKIR
jgi:hypothetical protein